MSRSDEETLPPDRGPDQGPDRGPQSAVDTMMVGSSGAGVSGIDRTAMAPAPMDPGLDGTLMSPGSGGAVGDTLAQSAEPGTMPPGAATGARASEGQGFVDPPRIGRHVIIDRLGAGGMGVVYAAYDPQLDRKIAVKLVLPEPGAESLGGSSGATDRLLREAQGMAQVSDPNVIAVFDTGTYQGQVYIAMEYVDGWTLGEWLETEGTDGGKKAGWEERLRRYLDAARGLAAAHRRDLVHRDFKPDNVMVGKDGRVRVMDFGLVRRAPDQKAIRIDGPGSDGPGSDRKSEKKSDREASLIRSVSSQNLAVELTSAGAIMGTPAYMAPEQFAGEVADARADQFSFCVALYRALYDQPPFAGDAYLELARSVSLGALKPPPRGTAVPARIGRAITRGLNPEPAERWPNMDALIAELEYDPSVRRNRALLGVAAVGLGGFGLWGALRVPETPPDPMANVCKGAADKLEGVWNDARRAKIEAAFAESGAKFGRGAYRGFSDEIDGWTARWVEMRTDTCEATRIRGEQSERLLDLRMTCLDQHMQALQALLEVYDEADVAAVTKAVQASTALPPMRACADADALLSATPPPSDPEVAKKVDTLRPQVMRMKALFDAGHPMEAVEEGTPIVAQVRETAYDPLLADALYYFGSVQFASGKFPEARDSLAESFHLGLASRADESMRRSSTLLVYLTGAVLSDTKQAEEWAAIAEAAVRRTGDDPVARARLLSTHGLVVSAAGDHARSRAMHQEVLELRSAALGAEHPHVAYGLVNLSADEYHLGERAQASEHLERAIEILDATEGPMHPNVLRARNNYGVYIADAGRYDEALAYHRETMKRRDEVLGKDHPDYAESLKNIGAVLIQDARYDEALEPLKASLAIREKAYGPTNARLFPALNDLGNVYGKTGQLDAAREVTGRAREIAAAAYGPDHWMVGQADLTLGGAELHAGNFAAAVDALERALDNWEKSKGPDNPEVAHVCLGLAQAKRGLGRLEPARTMAERADRILRANHGADHPDLVMVSLTLAKIDLDAGRREAAEGRLETIAALDVKTGKLGQARDEAARLLAGDEPLAQARE